MKLILAAIGSGICFGVAFFFTLSQAHAGFCIATWSVSLALESIDVGGELVDEYKIDNVSWSNNARTEVEIGEPMKFEGNTVGDERVCFEYERD